MSKELVIRALGSRGKLFTGEITSVEVLGSVEKIKWNQGENELTVKMPREKISQYAVTVKLTLN